MLNSDLVMRARYFAAGAHIGIGQKRKGSGLPYITHPIEVATILSRHGFGMTALCAGLLHDVVEDTKVAIEDVLAHFGSDIARLVLEVTDVSKPEDGNRAVRKAMDRKHLANVSSDGQSIKCADIISNTKTILKDNPKFAATYIDEVSQTLEVLKKAKPEILLEAKMVVEEAKSMLPVEPK